jgi:Family of unknown function (DUF6186)
MTTHQATIAGFAFIAMSLIALELVAHRRGSRVPRAGQVLGFMMQTRITRLLILLLWGWLGWHFFAR